MWCGLLVDARPPNAIGGVLGVLGLVVVVVLDDGDWTGG